MFSYLLLVFVPCCGTLSIHGLFKRSKKNGGMILITYVRPGMILQVLRATSAWPTSDGCNPKGDSGIPVLMGGYFRQAKPGLVWCLSNLYRLGPAECYGDSQLRGRRADQGEPQHTPCWAFAYPRPSQKNLQMIQEFRIINWLEKFGSGVYICSFRGTASFFWKFVETFWRFWPREWDFQCPNLPLFFEIKIWKEWVEVPTFFCFNLYPPEV